MAEQSRRTGHRFGELEGRQRHAAILLVALFALTPFVAAAIGLSQRWQPTGDVAIIGLRSLDVWQGDAPLLGQPTTAEELTGTPSNHPGPIEYWVLALTTQLTGDRAGIALGAALVNALALTGVAWLSYRRGGVALLALMSVAVACLVRALGAASLYDPFNSELATYPMLLALVAAWCVLVGDLRVAPVLAAAASVGAQVHVAGAAFVVPLLLVGAGSIALAWRRHPATVRRDRPYLLGALGIIAVVWLPVIAYELGSQPSNVAALWRAATIPRPRIGLAFTLERVATAVAPIPTFVRSTGRYGFLRDEPAVGVLAAALIVATCAALATLVGRQDRRNHPGRLARLLLATTAFAVVSSAGQPPLSAFRADGTRWLWVVGLGIWVSVIWSAWNLAPPERRDRVRAALAPAAVVLTSVLMLVSLSTASLGEQRDGTLMAVTDRVATALVDELPAGTYHVRFEGNQALVTVGPGIAYRLEAAGSHVVLDRNVFTRGYAAGRTDGRSADAELRISSDGAATPGPGEELLAEAPITPGSAEGGTIKVFITR